MAKGEGSVSVRIQAVGATYCFCGGCGESVCMDAKNNNDSNDRRYSNSNDDNKSYVNTW